MEEPVAKPLFTLKTVTFLDAVTYPDINIQPDTATFITGESGCGKSTLLKLLNGSAKPTSGMVTYCGKDINHCDPVKHKREVLLAGQNVYLFDDTVANNFKTFHAYRELPAPQPEDVALYLRTCCAEFPLDSLCTTMSGGERQRIYLAICLSFMPRVLMLDEPTAALDDATAFRFFKQVKAFAQENNITLLTVCHNQALAQAFADHLIVLNRTGQREEQQ